MGTADRGRKKGAGGALVLLLAAALAFGSACGKKADPRAPEVAIPETIRDLKAEVQPKGIALSWGRPRRYVDGKALRGDLAAFLVFRKDISKACPDCPAPFKQRAKVEVEDQQKFIQKERFAFVDRELSPQTTYRYRVFSQLTDGSLSNPSNEVEVTWGP
ncbi:MAG TPA: hypothetical protein VNL14_09940 [Candidatus Acidoferrales bacterium]|nr:hypothetical protein [Candidatus Acidoferrales bacterium]